MKGIRGVVKQVLITQTEVAQVTSIKKSLIDVRDKFRIWLRRSDCYSIFYPIEFDEIRKATANGRFRAKCLVMSLLKNLIRKIPLRVDSGFHRLVPGEIV